nr:unnamed protein product [Callosobruchus analis]
MSEIKEFESVDSALHQLPKDDYERVKKILYGSDTHEISVPEESKEMASKYNIELISCGFNCKEEQLRSPKVVRIALFQHKLVPFPTTTPIQEMKYALFKFANKAIRIAARAGVNIFCFPETWNMPYAFCTREKTPWCEYAENAQFGPTTKMLQELATIHNMVIISPILERDEIHNDSIWNTAVVIDNHGDYLGKHRKNHIPRTADFSEPVYYAEGNTGHPVFEMNSDLIDVSEECEVMKINPLKNNVNVFQATVQVGKASYGKLLKAGNVFIGLDCCKVFDAVEVSRCYTCNGYSHSSKACRKEVTCPRCGENHELKACKSNYLKCINCVNCLKKDGQNIKVDHAAWDRKNCLSYRIACDRLKSDILERETNKRNYERSHLASLTFGKQILRCFMSNCFSQTGNLFRALKRRHDNETEEQYKNIRQEIKRSVDIAYKNYIRTIENNVKRDSTKFWHFVHSKKGQCSVPKNMTYNDINLSNPQDIADSFADFFAESLSVDNLNSYVGRQEFNSNPLILTSVTPDQVFNALKRLKPKLTSGPDRIPAFILRDCAVIFAPPLATTEFGKIAVCFGRHHPLDWLVFGLNGAELVFCPAAAGGVASEPLWSIESRNAAITNNYFTCAVNRVGTEVFENEFSSGDGKQPHRDSEYFYGSSFVTAPNGTRSPLAQRLDIYAECLSKATKHDFVPHIIRKACKPSSTL